VGTDVVREGDAYKVILTGEMREAELFGENMVLRRRIESTLGENSVTITDEIENQSFRPEPLMLLYHCNMGYPFLDESCELYVPTAGVKGREAFSEEHLDRWNLMDVPKDNEDEYVYIHDMKSDENLDTMALVVNHTLNIGLCISFNQKNLPYFMEWKSMGSGDYVLGLEPSNSSVYGKLHHIEHDSVHYLQPFEKETNTLRFTVVEGEAQIAEMINKINTIKGDH
jgi:hypothetical protein